jgi:HNH endonuclease
MAGKKTRTLRERLLSRAVINRETGCWEWAGSKDKRGYGRIAVDGSPRLVHRVAYEMWWGPLPPHREDRVIRELDHLCGNHSCLNPGHLELVSHQINMQRADMSNVGLANRLKTHCPKGHPYDEENTYARPSDGKRFCRTCYRERDEAMRRAAGAGPANATKTHCPRGHPYDEANTYAHVGKDGRTRRHCRTCMGMRLLKFRAAS